MSRHLGRGKGRSLCGAPRPRPPPIYGSNRTERHLAREVQPSRLLKGMPDRQLARQYTDWGASWSEIWARPADPPNSTAPFPIAVFRFRLTRDVKRGVTL